MTKLSTALRKKFPGRDGPRRLIKAIGLDEKLLDNVGRERSRLAFDSSKERTMKKPNRLQAYLVVGAARIFNPQLAMDAKDVDYSKLFTGVTTKTLKAKKPTIVADAKKLLKGKTLAKDASMESLAHLLDQFEGAPAKDKLKLDESVSAPQHKAMEAAAHGHSDLGIPKNVGQEFEHADKGKSFGDMLKDWISGKDDWSGGMSDDDVAALTKMHEDAMPENGLDEEPEEALDEETEEEEAEDESEAEHDEEEAEDEAEEEGEKPGKKKPGGSDAARPGKPKPKKGGAMDTKKYVTVDAMNKAVEAGIATVTKKLAGVQEAREFVRPYVGELSLALDSAEKVLRAAATAMDIEDADTIHVSALKTVIKSCGTKIGAEDEAPRQRQVTEDEATTADNVSSFDKFYPDASRIKSVA